MEVKVNDAIGTDGDTTLVELSSFMFAGNTVRVMGTSDAPWFFGNEIATLLGYKKPANAIAKHVNSDDKCLASALFTDSLKRGVCKLNQYDVSANCINESGFWALALASKLESAKPFKKWVTGELLPSLRKTGEYKIKGQLQAVQNELANQRLLTDKSIQEAAEQKRIADASQFQREKEQKEHEEEVAKKDEELKNAREAAKNTEATKSKWIAASVDTALVPKTHIMYIASNKYLMSKHKFKVGGNVNIENCMHRIRGYCTVHPADDPIYAIAMYQCHDYLAVENLFWITGERFRDKPESPKEMICLEGASVIRILEDAIWSIDQNVASHVSQYAEFKRATVEDPPKIYEPLDLSSILTHKPKVSKKSTKIDTSDFSDADINAVIIDKINEYARVSDADYDFSTHKNQRDLKITWKEFIPKFDKYDGKSRMEWRAAAKLLCDGTKVILNIRDT